ncbi:MAG: hypothetical protein JXR30_00055 [Alphaproteobacteria bacterium]|nr:hypothetical protein [Alphaproteobacteria bacterium]
MKKLLLLTFGLFLGLTLSAQTDSLRIDSLIQNEYHRAQKEIVKIENKNKKLVTNKEGFYTIQYKPMMWEEIEQINALYKINEIFYAYRKGEIMQENALKKIKSLYDFAYNLRFYNLANPY